MDFTGERFIPNNELINDEIGIEHLHRYHTALDFVKDRVVLDIACGEGYGAAILSRNAKEVIGIDIDATSIAFARATYTSRIKNLNFTQGSVEKIPLPDNSIDVVISFETIEHVDESTQHSFLKEVKRVLKQDGRFIISTPDRVNYSERYSYKNEFHIKEFSSGEFALFLNGYFKNVETFYQGFEIISAITEPNTSTIANVKVCHWGQTSATPSRKYLIAVCSDLAHQDNSNFSSVVLNVNKSYFDLTDRITHNEAHVLELGAWGKSLDKVVEERDATILELSNKSIANDSEIQAKNLLIQELQIEKQRLENQLKEERESSQQKIEQLSNELSDSNRTVQEQKQKTHQLYQEVDALRGRLEEIYVSEGWKLLSVYYNIKGKALPENSNRYQTLKKAVNAIRRKKENQPFGFIELDKVADPRSNQHQQLTYDPFELPFYEVPQVSIIIPAYNAWEMNYKCIRSIKENTFGVSYEVIIGDDCSTDRTKEIGGFIKNVVPVRNESNLGFLQNCNHAASFAKGKYIHFLNNDTEVKPGWLSSLVDLMEKDASIGMVGSKLLYPDGRLQEAGGIIWNDASGWNYGHKQDPDAPEYNYVKEVDYISGASIMIRHSLWKEINGFDIRYSPAYFEDTDIAFEVSDKGYKVVYQPLSEVIHYEGYSHGTDTNATAESGSIKRYQQINKTKFFQKWRDTLESKNFPNAENIFWARDKSSQRKTILVIDHYVPQYDKDAGSRNTYLYLELFKSLNLNIKFIGDNFYKHEPYTTTLQQMGVEVLYGNYYKDNWQEWVKENREKIDFVYLNRPHISIKYIDFIKNNIKAKILYFGHDLHYYRELKQYEVEKKPELLASAKKWKKTEQYLFDHADVILTPSEEEKTIIKELAPSKDVQSIRLFFYKSFNKHIQDFKNRNNILFVGGFNHKPNVDGVLWFTDQVWPIVKEKVPSANFVIVGSKPPKEILELASGDIIVKGYVSDDELVKQYNEAKLVVIPLRYGAGVKGKVVEAMYHGVPIITTPEGIEGMPGDLAFIEPLAKAEEFAEQIIRYHKNEEELTSLSKQEITYMENNFSWAVAKDAISSILKLS